VAKESKKGDEEENRCGSRMDKENIKEIKAHSKQKHRS